MAFDAAQKTISQRFINPLYKISELFNSRLRTQIETVRNFGKRVVIDRRNGHPNQEYSDLLQLFMEYRDEIGDGLDDDALVDQVINFIIAGRDTTAQTLSWLFFCLSENPRVVDKVIQEAKSVVGECDFLSYEHVKQMEYAKAVFKETLRLYPPVSRNSKQAVNDDILPNGVKIKKGQMIGLVPYAMGRSEKIWKDPLAFKPERWIGTASPTPYKFPAFNAGPRVCIGKVIAELQGVFVFVSLLQKFKFKVLYPEKVCSVISLTLPMKDGLICEINSRS
jgi:cytochrome P450